MQSLGGKVETVEADGEYGRTSIRTTQASELYTEETDHAQSVWMSHGDKVAELPEGFQPVATSEKVHRHHPPQKSCYRIAIAQSSASSNGHFAV